MKLHLRTSMFAASMMAILTACSGDDGSRGEAGQQGPQGEQGLQSLVKQTVLAAGHWQCFKGGIQIDSGIDDNNDSLLDQNEVDETNYLCTPSSVDSSKNFKRVASFPVCSQIDSDCNTDETTAAEIVAASVDGMTLIYTDSPAEQIGFVDITDPATPLAAGVLALNGEPTSVAVKGGVVLVGVNTSADYINVSGELAVVDIATQTLVRSIDLGGQPDSVAVSPDGNYAVVAIENERDEDLGDGAPPQLPAGNIVIVDLSGEVADWSTSVVDVTGLSDLYPSDPEPEYVDINSNNIAVVTFQENNFIALINLADASVMDGFSAGSVDLNMIDTDEDSGEFIFMDGALDGVLREPDGVAWINNEYFATADEGDLDGGSRGFTVFHIDGTVVWSSGNQLEHLTARFGHYPESRSENKGNEPENAEVGVFGDERFLFVNSERSSLVFVYDVADPQSPVYKQALPAAMGPEGVLAIPARNLLIAASEEDAREDGIRSALNIYAYVNEAPQYPTLQSADRNNGTPIPWAALSGLAGDPWNADRLYSVDDNYFLRSRIFTIDISTSPAMITHETYVKDSNNVFAGFAAVALADASVDDDDASRVAVFDEADLAKMINEDKTVNADLEGIAKAADGGFWLASEGEGTIGDDGRPVNTLNFVFKTDAYGVIEDVLTLPATLNDMQVRFGFEGIAEYNGKVYVAVQRAWGSDDNPRIAIYDLASETWSSVFYPLDSNESQVSGAWVGLSDITSLNDGRFLVLERDNQMGPDAAIKRLYMVDLSTTVDGETISKTLVRDVIPDIAAKGGLVPEKIEGSAITADGKIYILNDNDGVEDNSGESQLLQLKGIALP
ncbi:hypothetical protein TDB9533_01609 [Thalassocella blandensis]|nr:hypothetical protein TDB9533_01609 [Thalassocella blandensis]